jgi:type 1 fimbria pilin
MKKTLLSTVPFLALCALTASMAQAATTTNLTLTGQILPNACDISVANGGVLALGDIPFASLNATGMTDVTPVANKLTTTITCTNTTRVAFGAIDNRLGSASNETSPPPNAGLPQKSRFGLGLVNSKPLGSVIFAFTGTPTLDGSPAGMFYTDNQGLGFGAAAGLDTIQNNLFAVGKVGAYGIGATFIFDISPNIAITDRKNLPTNQPINIDGSVTIELVYL